MVIHRSRFWEKVVFYEREQSTRNLGQYRGEDVVGICRKHMSDFRPTTPLSRSQFRSKRHGKLSIHSVATQETIEAIFRIIVSANQLSLYGAVAETCVKSMNQSLPDRSGRPDMMMGQSIVLSAIKTEVPLDCDDPTNQDLLLQPTGLLRSVHRNNTRLYRQLITSLWFVTNLSSSFFIVDCVEQSSLVLPAWCSQI